MDGAHVLDCGANSDSIRQKYDEDSFRRKTILVFQLTELLFKATKDMGKDYLWRIPHYLSVQIKNDSVIYMEKEEFVTKETYIDLGGLVSSVLVTDANERKRLKKERKGSSAGKIQGYTFYAKSAVNSSSIVISG